MVSDAERFKAEDEAATKRVNAKSHLETYAYSLRNSIQDTNFASKLDAGDKDKLEKAINDTISWLDKNTSEEKESFEEKQKELEKIAMPIMTKAYQKGGVPPGAGAGDMPPGAGGGMGAGDDEDMGTSGGPSASGTTTKKKGPTVEEVD